MILLELFVFFQEFAKFGSLGFCETRKAKKFGLEFEETFEFGFYGVRPTKLRKFSWLCFSYFEHPAGCLATPYMKIIRTAFGTTFNTNSRTRLANAAFLDKLSFTDLIDYQSPSVGRDLFDSYNWFYLVWIFYGQIGIP